MDIYTRIHNRTSEETRQKVRNKMYDIMNENDPTLDETDEFFRYFYDNAVLEQDVVTCARSRRLKNLWISRNMTAYWIHTINWNVWVVDDQGRIKVQLLDKGSYQKLKHILNSVPEII